MSNVSHTTIVYRTTIDDTQYCDSSDGTDETQLVLEYEDDIIRTAIFVFQMDHDGPVGEMDIKVDVIKSDTEPGGHYVLASGEADPSIDTIVKTFDINVFAQAIVM